MKNDFNTIAPIYDTLARIVFGRSLDRAQQSFLTHIEANSRVLIVGGGTGKILAWLPEDLGLEIDYVELSKGMLHKASSRISKGNEVRFACQDVREVRGNYDIIITNFFLDCFSINELEVVLLHLNGLLCSGGKFLVTDFYPTDAWHHKLLIQTMHRFFRAIARLEADSLTDIHEKVKEAKLLPIALKFFRNGSVFSAVYRRLT